MAKKDPLKNQKALKDIPWHTNRPKNWIRYGDEVFVIIRDQETRILMLARGFIASQPGSRVGDDVDNIHRTIVWFRKAIDPEAANVKDAHERVYDVNDRRLIRADEICILCSPKRMANRFIGLFDEDDLKSMAKNAQELLGVKTPAEPQRKKKVKKKRSRNRRAK